MFLSGKECPRGRTCMLCLLSDDGQALSSSLLHISLTLSDACFSLDAQGRYNRGLQLKSLPVNS